MSGFLLFQHRKIHAIRALQMANNRRTTTVNEPTAFSWRHQAERIIPESGQQTGLLPTMT